MKKKSFTSTFRYQGSFFNIVFRKSELALNLFVQFSHSYFINKLQSDYNIIWTRRLTFIFENKVSAFLIEVYLRTLI
jgi:hypothetical protein